MLSHKEIRQIKLDRLIQWQAGETPGPVELIIFPTNRCNLRCTICWQRWAEEEYGEVDTMSEISDARFLELVEEAAALDVKFWKIVGGGDPMVRGELVTRMCEKICALNMNGEIYSNGTLFTEPFLTRLIQCGWHMIKVSLDGPTAEINDAIRSKGSFERATKNLRLLKELKKNHNSSYPMAAWDAVITNLNYTRIEEMILLAHELGCQEFYVTKLIVQGTACSQFQLTEQQEKALPDVLIGAYATAQRLKIRHNLHDLIPSMEIRNVPLKQDEVVSSVVGDGRFTDALCFEAWTSMAILADYGKTGPCCVFWEENVAGIRDHSLTSLWQGTYMESLRNRLRTRKDIPVYCKNCCSNQIADSEYFRRDILYINKRKSFRQKSLTGKVSELCALSYAYWKRKGFAYTTRRMYEWILIHIVKITPKEGK